MRGDFDEARRLWASRGPNSRKCSASCFDERGVPHFPPRSRRSRVIMRLPSESCAGATRRWRAWARRACERRSQASSLTRSTGRAATKRGRFTEIGEGLAADDVVPQILWRSVRAKILARRGEPGEELAREAAPLVEHTDFPISRRRRSSTSPRCSAPQGMRTKPQSSWPGPRSSTHARAISLPRSAAVVVPRATTIWRDRMSFQDGEWFRRRPSDG